MNDVQTSKQSFWTQKNNNAKYGFFPTPLDVVKMEMDLIDFSEISGEIPITLADFTGGDGEQLNCMHEYISSLGFMAASYYNEITKERYDKANEKYINNMNFHLLNTDFFYMKLRYKEGKSYLKSCVAILRNNPPYIWMEHHGQKVRGEELFFMENTPYNITGGIQIFELPLYQLVQQVGLMRKICFRYENVHIFKFPDSVFENFKQVVVIGQKKSQNSNDIEIADQWVERLKTENIEKLNEVTTPIIKLDDKILSRQRAVNVFRDGRVSNITLTNGLNDVMSDLFKAEKDQDNFMLDVLIEKPIIEKLPGHLASELSSGKYNGIMGNVLIRGGANKVVEVTASSEGDTKVTEETEVLKPFVEITNKNGDIIYKDY